MHEPREQEGGKGIDRCKKVLVAGQFRKVAKVIGSEMCMKTFPVGVSREETENCQTCQFCYAEIMFLGWRTMMGWSGKRMTDRVYDTFEEVINETADHHKNRIKVGML